MKKLAFCMVMAFAFFNCQSQSSKEKIAQELKIDTLKPQTKIKVNKKYDEFGNLIALDSSYSYFYSNIKGDSILEKEIFNQFKSNFNDEFNNIDSLFKNNSFNNSLLNQIDFYSDDFFKKSFQSHQKHINQLLKRMDSSKNSFYKNHKNEQ